MQVDFSHLYHTWYIPMVTFLRILYLVYSCGNFFTDILYGISPLSKIVNKTIYDS